jgi:hypothetical protein
MNAACEHNPLAYHFGSTYSRFVRLGLGDILSGPLIGLVLQTLKGRILMLTLATLRLRVKCHEYTQGAGRRAYTHGHGQDVYNAHPNMYYMYMHVERQELSYFLLY